MLMIKYAWDVCSFKKKIEPQVFFNPSLYHIGIIIWFQSYDCWGREIGDYMTFLLASLKGKI